MYILVGECSAFLASGSDPTDERRMKHGPQTTPRRGRREVAACALTERVIARPFHLRMRMRFCHVTHIYKHYGICARPDRYEQSPSRLRLFRIT